MNTYNWYSHLIKPSWAPAPWVFGSVWGVLYVLITISFGYVFFMFFKGQVPIYIVLPFILNLIFNFAFTPIQFGMKNNYLAAVDIILILATLVWAMVAIFGYANWITYIQIPYVLWVSIATVLQLSIVYLNRKNPVT
ncbi:MAG: TspO/MBR family protein [Candidatus Saccharibacteria bacterium]